MKTQSSTTPEPKDKLDAKATKTADAAQAATPAVATVVFAFAAQVSTTVFTMVLTLYLARALGPAGYSSGCYRLAFDHPHWFLRFSAWCTHRLHRRNQAVQGGRQGDLLGAAAVQGDHEAED